MVRIADVDTFNDTNAFFSSDQKRFDCRLGNDLRFDLILECETLLPTSPLFPVNWQVLDMITSLALFIRR